MIHADSIKVDNDDGRIVLVLDTWTDDPNEEYQASMFTVDIHDIALEFYAEVRRELGPYANEAESARAAFVAGVSLTDYLGAPQPVTSRPVSVEDAIDAGYALDDPKSPGFHDRMVD